MFETVRGLELWVSSRDKWRVPGPTNKPGYSHFRSDTRTGYPTAFPSSSVHQNPTPVAMRRMFTNLLQAYVHINITQRHRQTRGALSPI